MVLRGGEATLQAAFEAVHLIWNGAPLLSARLLNSHSIARGQCVPEVPLHCGVYGQNRFKSATAIAHSSRILKGEVHA